MRISQKIIYSFLGIIFLFTISMGSVFIFHSASLKEYRDISSTLILENTLMSKVSEYMEAYNQLSVAPTNEERILEYERKRDAILATFEALDTAVVDEDSKVAYEGLKNIILGILSDLEKARVLLAEGDIVGADQYYVEAINKKPFVDINVTLLVIKELEYFNGIKSSIESQYQEKLFVVFMWVLTTVFTTLLYGLIFSRRLTTPINMLFEVAQKVTAGDYSSRIPTQLLVGKDEVGTLANAMNTMLITLNRNLSEVERGHSIVLETKKHLEERNSELEKSQLATINLLEDLAEEKEAIEQKVADRTAEIEHEKNKLLQVTSNMKGGAILMNESKEIVFTNELAYKILGVPSKDTSSNHMLKAFHDFFAGPELQKQLNRCFNKESFRVPEIVGGEKVFEVFFHYIAGTSKEDKSSEGYFILFFDITEAKLLERSKSELVAVASHQLRTPLTAMRGNVEMLVDESYGPLNKEQHELLDDIEVSTIRLITMVNEMLDITKIEKGDMEMTFENLNVKEVLESVTYDLSSYAKRHEFIISIAGVADNFQIKGDKVRVRQIFQNLIDNAIKYSSHPGTLEISAVEKDEYIKITFKDNGIGIPKKEQANLFGRFYRASNTSKTASSGSGLGLYIVKSIAEQLGGDIRFESQEDVGTTFFVELPICDKTLSV